MKNAENLPKLYMSNTKISFIQNHEKRFSTHKNGPNKLIFGHNVYSQGPHRNKWVFFEKIIFRHFLDILEAKNG